MLTFTKDAMLICRSVQMFSEKLIEEIIREAMEKGEFDDLPGKGKPLDLDAYFATPEDVRLGYSVLKSAGCLPVEVELQNEIESLTAPSARVAGEKVEPRLDSVKLGGDNVRSLRRHGRVAEGGGLLNRCRG